MGKKVQEEFLTAMITVVETLRKRHDLGCSPLVPWESLIVFDKRLQSEDFDGVVSATKKFLSGFGRSRRDSAVEHEPEMLTTLRVSFYRALNIVMSNPVDAELERQLHLATLFIDRYIQGVYTLLETVIPSDPR